MEMKKTKEGRAHFVEATYPEKEPWKTNVYVGPRDGSGVHAHLVASGAAILFLRDINGEEIIRNGKRVLMKEDMEHS